MLFMKKSMHDRCLYITEKKKCASMTARRLGLIRGLKCRLRGITP